ncbi:MAG: chemotaxis protein CheW [Halothece sp. Uz-M2-17]|nr:chemotaxis protein CheW [Halothece sp. Uz-M2-17]
MKTTRTTQRLQELLPRLFETEQQLSGERYLWFEITPHLHAAVNLSQVSEATYLSTTAITPIPQMPPYVLGWNNGRDRVFCVIALEELLGLGKATKIPQSYATVIVQIPSQRSEQGSLLLGLTVNRIIRTITMPTENIISPVGEFPAALTPYLKGYLSHEQHKIALLDLTALPKQIA